MSADASTASLRRRGVPDGDETVVAAVSPDPTGEGEGDDRGHEIQRPHEGIAQVHRIDDGEVDVVLDDEREQGRLPYYDGEPEPRAPDALELQEEEQHEKADPSVEREIRRRRRILLHGGAEDAEDVHDRRAMRHGPESVQGEE